MTNNTEDLTRAVTVKRNAKKKSGYTVAEQNGVYYVSEAPAKARVTPGDRVVGVNGIRSEEFLDEDDANDLIESIRIVVIPEDQIEEYDNAAAAAAAAEGGEEEYEEYDRRKKQAAAEGDDDEDEDDDDRAGLNGVPRSVGGPGARGPENNGERTRPGVIHCNHCEHDNDDLSVDEDGDYVCEECGHVIELPTEDDVIHSCVQCGHDNRNLERDEDGDYVCQECGHVIPEDNVLMVPENGGHNHPNIYECPDCHHENADPLPDDEGDLVCEECGCILPPKATCTCAACDFENVEPEMNEDGDYICENCGEVLDVEMDPEMTGAEKLKDMSDQAASGPEADGQEFDENGNPLTNPEGKKLTPADMFGPGDVITVTVGKSHPKQDPGLKIEERNGKYYIKKVPSGGLFAKTPVIPTDKILELNGTDHHEFKDVNELKKIMRDESKITIVVLRKDPDASESSASSVDYDELNPITPDGVVKDEIVDRDDDTVGYDGEDCGCLWCPDCHPVLAQ